METNLLAREAFTAGILFSLAVMLCLLLRVVTRDDHPVIQRANRLALAGGLLGIVMLAAVNGVIYRYISRPLASFMLFPLILVSGAWLLLGMPRLHRYFAGKPRSKPSLGPEVGVENATRQQQREVWEQLRAMHHFRETLKGELISLATGDRVYWTTSATEPSLAVAFNSSSTLVVSHHETLVKYVDVQSNIARALQAAGSLNGNA